jgi:hypothetical protein
MLIIKYHPKMNIVFGKNITITIDKYKINLVRIYHYTSIQLRINNDIIDINEIKV